MNNKKLEVYNLLKNILLRKNLKFSNNLLKGRSYSCPDLLKVGKTERELEDKELDIAIVLEGDRLTISTSQSKLMKKVLDRLGLDTFNNIVVSTKKLTTLKNPDSSFSIIYPEISDTKAWEELVTGLSNLCLMSSITNSSNLIFYIVLEGISNDKRRKLFSFIVSKIITAFNVIYNFLIFRPFANYLSKKLVENRLSPKNEKMIISKLVNYMNSLKDLYSVNIGDSTYFFCIKTLKRLKISKEYIDNLIKEGADKNRLRTVNDWIVKAYSEDKDLIVYSDLDSYVSIAHELGHYELSKEGVLGTIQNNCKYQRAPIVTAINFFIGYLAGVNKSINTIAIGTIINFVLNTPQLAIEFLASYRGIKLLERLHVDKEVIKESRTWLGYAFLTYLNSAIARSGSSLTIGAGIGTAKRMLFK